MKHGGPRSPQELRERLWALGDLRYLLHDGQRDLHDRFYRSQDRRQVWLCSRRYGKSRLACVLAVETAIRRGGKIRIAAATAKEVRSIVEPHMRAIFAAAPPHARLGAGTAYSRQEGIWRLEWLGEGVEIHAAGCDAGNAERLRGTDMTLGIVEEAGTVDDLEYVVQDILLPQTLTTDGRMLLVGTPPRTPSHPFTAVYVRRASEQGKLVVRTIHDAPHIPAERIAEYCEESGGPTSTTWRREYLCEIVVDEALAVVPEWSDAEASVVEVRERPSHYVPLVAMDVGYQDLTFAVLGYHDFEAGLDVVTHEVVLRRATSSEINAAVTDAEREAFGERRVGYRVVDAPEIVVADLCRLAGVPRDEALPGAELPWTPAQKDDADAALNALRMRVGQHKLRIHPRCTHLIAHMKHAIWNKRRTTYERSGDSGHFDGVDAVKYFVRHLDRHTNPFPRRAVGVRAETHRIHQLPARSSELAAALRGKRR